jgi:hypothetical protein
MINQITTLRMPDGTEVAFVDWADKPLWSTVDLLSQTALEFTDNELDMFTYIAGDRVPATNNVTVRRTATEADTNLSTISSMASTEEMLVYDIRIEVSQLHTSVAAPTDLTSMTTTLFLGDPVPRGNRVALLNWYLLFRLEVSQKIEHSAPLGYYVTGYGAYSTLTAGTLVAAAGAVRTYGNQGLPSAEAVRAYVIPIHVGGQEKYRGQIVNPRGLPNTSFAGNTGIPAPTETQPPTQEAQVVYSLRVILDGLYKRPVE